MRKEPLILKIHRRGMGSQFKIPLLDLVEPFGKIIWGGYSLYSTKSLIKFKTEFGDPRYYIMPSEDGKVRRYTDRTRPSKPLCAGAFFNLMSKEEQEQFAENIDVLLEILKDE